MFRTRDFVLVLLSVAFLLVAISLTWLKQSAPQISKKDKVINPENVFVMSGGDKDYTAVISSPSSPDRKQNVEKMREKVMASGELTLLEEESAPEENNKNSDNDSRPDNTLTGELRCPDYAPYVKPWSAKDILVKETEGARVFYREINKQTAFAGTSSAASVTSPTEVLLQLPIAPAVSANPYCLSSDIIGIAKDGSLIRNNEKGLYGIFSADTLIGYALDGVPIYGLTNQKVDQCGGNTLNGEYRYFITRDKDVIIDCFSALPVSL